MRKFSILMLLFYITLSIFAQTETYNGPYWVGTAKYQYTTNSNFTRTYHGDFKYTNKENETVVGKFKNDLKDGKWVSNLFGINEIIHFKEGIRDGDYSFSYKDEKREIKISAHFTNGELDTLSHYSKDQRYGSIKGNIGKNGKINNSWVQISDNIENTQTFYKSIFIGDISQDLRTGDQDKSLGEIFLNLMVVAQNLKEDNTMELDGDFYHIVPQKYHTINGLFDFTVNYLPDKALIPTYLA